MLCKELKVKSSKAPKVTIFKDVDDKDLGLNIMRCASLKYAQILPIKYVLSLSVKAERQRNKASSGGQG